jgi:putative YhbY family RNA-binding protein
MTLSLTPRQRAHLKGRAHVLEPVVFIGQAGLSDSVVIELERALAAHGLIKVKLAGAGRGDREALTKDICERSGAAAVQNVGRILVLWRPRPDDEPLPHP